MIKQLVFYKIDSLIAKAPSVMAVGTMVWPIRIISLILAPFFIIAGAIIFLVSLKIIEALQDQHVNMEDNDITLLSLFGLVGGLGMVVCGVLFIIIAWLCNLVRNRNNYIEETESVLQSVKFDLQTSEEMPKSN